MYIPLFTQRGKGGNREECIMLRGEGWCLFWDESKQENNNYQMWHLASLLPLLSRQLKDDHMSSGLLGWAAGCLIIPFTLCIWEMGVMISLSYCEGQKNPDRLKPYFGKLEMPTIMSSVLSGQCCSYLTKAVGMHPWPASPCWVGMLLLLSISRDFLQAGDKENIFNADHFPLWYRRAAEQIPGSFVYSIPFSTGECPRRRPGHCLQSIGDRPACWAEARSALGANAVSLVLKQWPVLYVQQPQIK